MSECTLIVLSSLGTARLSMVFKLLGGTAQVDKCLRTAEETSSREIGFYMITIYKRVYLYIVMTA